MPYIPLEEHLPGITGLLEYRKDTAAPIRELTQILLRGPSTLTEGERELIATIESVQKAKDAGATDIEIHDTVLIAALFCLYNRYVDGLSTVTPADPEFYKGLGQRLKDHGYHRLPQGYDHLKKSKQ